MRQFVVNLRLLGCSSYGLAVAMELDRPVSPDGAARVPTWRRESEAGYGQGNINKTKLHSRKINLL